MSQSPEFDQPELFPVAPVTEPVPAAEAVFPTEPLKPLAGDYQTVEKAATDRLASIAEHRGADVGAEQTGRTQEIILAATGTREFGRVRREDRRKLAVTRNLTREEAGERSRQINQALYRPDGQIIRTPEEVEAHKARVAKANKIYLDRLAEVRAERSRANG